MADKKISDLSLLSSGQADRNVDYVPVVDPSEAAAADRNKRIFLKDLVEAGLGATIGTGPDQIPLNSTVASYIPLRSEPAQSLENVSGATGVVFPDDSESKMTPQQMLVFDPVFIPAELNGEITLFADGVMGVYITNDKKIRLNYYGAFETTQTIAVSDDWITVSVVSDDNEQDTVSVFFLVNGVLLVVQVGEFSPMAQRDVLGDAGFRWLFNPGMEYLTNANINRVTLPGQAIGTVRDIGPNGLNGSQATATARPLAGRVPVGGRRNLWTNSDSLSNFTIDNATLTQTSLQSKLDPQRNLMLYVPAAGTVNAFIRRAFDGGTGFSFEVEAAGYTSITLTSSSSFYGASFNLVTGEVGQPTASIIGTAAMENLGGDRWRIFLPTSFGSLLQVKISTTGGKLGGDSTQTYDGVSGVYIGSAMSEAAVVVSDYQRVGTTARDVTEPGVPDVHYAYLDGNDDVISMTLPSSITGGTIIVAGLNGIFVDDNFSASAGAFSVGPTTYTGGPAGLLAATGSPIGVTVVDGQLTESELEQERKFYIQNGAPDVPVVI